jgi:S1-C subfamily serine protease
MRRITTIMGMSSALLLAGCGFGEEVTPTVGPAPRPISTAVSTSPAGSSQGGEAQAGGGAGAALPVIDAVSVVEQVMPAVVTVVNRRIAGDQISQQTLEAGRGTGFIIDGEGHVVTNEHVVRGGDRFQVILSDGSVRDAELAGADPLSDLAVVTLEGPPPAVAAFGDSDALKQGQPVLAVGSPLGEFTGTVTDGIVSALNRDFPGGGQGEAAYSNLIQHNAAINPGNSGGPLFDLNGRVIGVNTLGIQQTNSGLPAQGLFFAIPSNSVARIAAALIEQGRVAYPYIGIEYVSITPETAQVYGLPVSYGAYVEGVVPGGPADAAGVRPGDIVTAIGDFRIDGQLTFTEALFAYGPGATIPVTVQRDSGERQLEIRLAERPGR